MARPIRPTRIAALALATALGLAGLAACSSRNASASCSLSSCTVSLNRGVDAEASVLGVKLKLVNVVNDQVTVDVNGTRLVLPTGGGSTSGGGLNLSVSKVTSDQVVLQVSQA